MDENPEIRNIYIEIKYESGSRFTKIWNNLFEYDQETQSHILII